LCSLGPVALNQGEESPFDSMFMGSDERSELLKRFGAIKFVVWICEPGPEV
jgi:hypothetical protein